MDQQSPEWLEKIRQQFDFAPYPRVPLDLSPKADYNGLFIHNLVTSYYVRSQQVTSTKDKLILDAGCGSGYKSLTLAVANPGARIVGIDLSSESVKLAGLRLKHHGFDNSEFHALAIEDLPKLGLQFDYINCDEVLYLLPDPVAGLQAMKSVLKPDGIIRANLHSSLQRQNFYVAQELFKMMGLMESSPEEFEVNVVADTMQSLKDTVLLKAQTWGPKYQLTEDPEQGTSNILVNHLLVGDKGFTIPQLFTMLEATELSFINMVNWQHWNVTNLFKRLDTLPSVWKTTLETATTAKRLHLYELLHPLNRLLDFWCGHPEQTQKITSVAQWEDADWLNSTVHLHPQLRVDAVKEHLTASIHALTPFDISRYINLGISDPIVLDNLSASLLLPLWDNPQPLAALVDRYRKVRSLHPVTLEPLSQATALQEVKQILLRLETVCYVLLERAN